MKKFWLEWAMKLIAREPSLEVVLTNMLLADWPRKSVDTLFFFGRTEKDAAPLFSLAGNVYCIGLVKSILINGSEDNSKCPHTRKVWTATLRSYGVHEVQAFPPAFNTTQEAEEMIKYSRGQGWRSAAIIAQPHQILRCMCALVGAMQKSGYWMRIYCITPKSCDWFVETTGSQDLMPAPRWRHIALEYSRILRYVMFRHIASLKEVLKYLERRETIY